MDAGSTAMNSNNPAVYAFPEVLLKASQSFEAEQYVLCIENSLIYLRQLPVSYAHQAGQQFEHFKILVSNMMKDGHDYASGIDLLRTAEVMGQFAEIFTIHSEKKGVYLAPPKPAKHEAHLILFYCLHLHQIISARLEGGLPD